MVDALGRALAEVAPEDAVAGGVEHAVAFDAEQGAVGHVGRRAALDVVGGHAAEGHGLAVAADQVVLDRPGDAFGGPGLEVPDVKARPRDVGDEVGGLRGEDHEPAVVADRAGVRVAVAAALAGPVAADQVDRAGEEVAAVDVARAAAAHDEVRGARLEQRVRAADRDVDAVAVGAEGRRARGAAHERELVVGRRDAVVDGRDRLVAGAVGGRDHERLLARGLGVEGRAGRDVAVAALEAGAAEVAAAVLGQVEAAGAVDAALGGLLDLDVRRDRVVVGLRAGDPGVRVGAVLVAVAEAVEHVRRVRGVDGDLAVSAQRAGGGGGSGPLSWRSVIAENSCVRRSTR